MDQSATAEGDPHTESRRMIQAYRQNKLPKVKLAGPDHEEIPDQPQPEDKPLTTGKEKPPVRSAKDSSPPTKAQKAGEEEKTERGGKMTNKTGRRGATPRPPTSKPK